MTETREVYSKLNKIVNPLLAFVYRAKHATPSEIARMVGPELPGISATMMANLMETYYEKVSYIVWHNIPVLDPWHEDFSNCRLVACYYPSPSFLDLLSISKMDPLNCAAALISGRWIKTMAERTLPKTNNTPEQKSFYSFNELKQEWQQMILSCFNSLQKRWENALSFTGGSLCVICQDKVVSHIYTPCGHLCVCGQDLCTSLHRCPICRSPIEKCIRVFVSGCEAEEITSQRTLTHYWKFEKKKDKIIQKSLMDYWKN